LVGRTVIGRRWEEELSVGERLSLWWEMLTLRKGGNTETDYLYAVVLYIFLVPSRIVGFQPILRLLSCARRTPVQAATSCDASPYFERRRFITAFVSLHSRGGGGGDTRTQNWVLATRRPFWTVATIAEAVQNSDTPSLSLAQSGSA